MDVHPYLRLHEQKPRSFEHDPSIASEARLDQYPELILDRAAILAKWDHDTEAVDSLLDTLESHWV
ncbi:hypothetical protein [Gordonia sp. MP11Mi]|uniref:hypothetical protein n=1 Tax=Gordonia sp. MP11Mi TaxID=3022769 RepID=UPI003B224F10